MSENKDFESIGRYHAAMERVRDLLVRRQCAASRAGHFLKRADHLGSTDSIARIDHAKLQSAVDEMVSFNFELEAAIQDADQYALAAGKRQIYRT